MDIDETVNEVSEPMPEASNITESDLQNSPTIFVTRTDWGGVEFGSNQATLPIMDAIAMLEIAKHELVLQQVAAQNRERAARKPNILLPR
jgi:hypothetical protein